MAWEREVKETLGGRGEEKSSTRKQNYAKTAIRKFKQKLKMVSLSSTPLFVLKLN